MVGGEAQESSQFIMLRSNVFWPRFLLHREHCLHYEDTARSIVNL